MKEHWSTLKKLIWLYATKLKGGASAIIETITGTLPLVLQNAISHAIVSLTRYGKCEQRNLPAGYTQLDYIEGNGTAYIDTGVLLSNTDVFEITFQSLNALASPVMGAISGGTSYTSTDNLSVTYTISVGLSAYSVYCDGAAGDANYSWNGGNRADGLKHTIKYNGLNIAPMLDGVAMTQATSHTLVENTPTVTTWLFGRNSTSTGTLAQSGVRIFDCNIQGKGHFIPARRNSDNVLGMYDTVSGSFFTNAGTGSFTAGPVATPTPDAPVDIVCNNGRVVAGNCISSIPDGQGTFITPSESTANRVYKAFPTGLVVGRSYTVTVTGANWLMLVQRKKTDGTDNSNVSGWATTYDFTPEEGYIYGVAMRRSQDAITPADFNGTLTLDTTDGEPWTVGTPEVLTVSGKNLLDQSQDVALLCVGATGREYAVGPLYGHTAFIPVKPNTSYTWSGLGAVSAVAVYRGAMYSDSSFDSFVSNINGPGGSTGTFTTTADTMFVVLNIQVAEESQQLELGSTATAYEPYVAPQTTSVPMLLSLGDYKDSAEIISGLQTHKIGVKVLDGTEGWAKYNDVFFCNDTISPANLNTACVCTHYVGVEGSTALSSMSDGQIKTGTSSSTRRLFIRDDSCETADDLTAKLTAQYAAGTPVIVLYPMATETTEQTTPQHLVTHKGTNVVDSVANVSPVEAKVEYYASESTTPQLLGMMGTTDPQDEPEAAEESSEPEESEESEEI